jgi:hypothetical protein
MEIYCEEIWIDQTRNVRYGVCGIYKTSADTPGELYRAMVREYGRCTSRVYIDSTDAKPVAIGWVFVKRQQYEDSPETFLKETWVTLHTAPDTVTREPHYLVLKG